MGKTLSEEEKKKQAELKKAADEKTKLEAKKAAQADKDDGADSGNAEEDPDGKKAVDEKTEPEAEKDDSVVMTMRHKTDNQYYFRCGLRLTKTFQNFRVRKEDIERLKRDAWIEIQGHE